LQRTATRTTDTAAAARAKSVIGPAADVGATLVAATFFLRGQGVSCCQGQHSQAQQQCKSVFPFHGSRHSVGRTCGRQPPCGRRCAPVVTLTLPPGLGHGGRARLYFRLCSARGPRRKRTTRRP
jgi:hypothetical protein